MDSLKHSISLTDIFSDLIIYGMIPGSVDCSKRIKLLNDSVRID